MEQLSVDGAGNYSNQVVRRRDDLTNSRLGFNVVHDSIRERGTVRPVRDLPSIFSKGDQVDKEGFIFPQGRILGKYDTKNYVGGAWEYNVNQGLAAVDGTFNAYTDADGAAQTVAYDDIKWGNSSDIEGLVAPANGNFTGGPFTDAFTSRDEDLAIIAPKTGASVTDGMAASVREHSGTGALKLFGVAKADTMRETRNNHQSYFRDTEAITVVKQGYITVPFLVDGAVIGAESYTAVSATDVPNFAISKDQTILFVQDRIDLINGATVHVDAFGNPILTIAADADHDVEFGNLVSFNHNVTLPFGEMTATVPNLELAGTGTQGIEYDVFYLARKVFPSATKKQIADYLNSADGMIGYATIYFDIP